MIRPLTVSEAVLPVFVGEILRGVRDWLADRRRQQLKRIEDLEKQSADLTKRVAALEAKP